TFTIYAPARFFMDFLRVNDIRYAGLTPAQYVTVFMLLGGLALFFRQPYLLKETTITDEQ
ncbi:MAG: hypothetical protein ACU85E_15935, partial [Gammaproteobacteria bacterium]